MKYETVTKRLDSNAKMKPSGVEWIAEIPKDWKIKRLKYIADLNMGQSPPSEEYNSDQLGTPFLQGNAEFGPHHPTPKIYCPTARKHASPGDILVSVRAPVGALNIADQEYGIGRGLCAIRSRMNQLERRYAKYLLEVVRTELHVVATGSTYDAVAVDDVSNITCVVPPFREQIQIAAFLDRKTGQIDELLRIKERRIELLQEQRTVLINQAVTKGLDPNVEMKPLEVEWIGKIPRHWTMERLKHVTESIKNGTTVPQIQSGQTDYPVTRIETISTGEINFDKVGHVNYWAGIENYRLRLGDILLSHINSLAILGNCAMLENSASLYHGMNLLRIRPNNLTDDRFLLYWLKSYPTNQLIKSFAKFAIGQVSISITNLKEIPISYPLLSEQTQIANFLDHKTKQIDELIAAEQRKIKLLKEYRQSLISEAVTGKIDVRSEV